MKTLVFLAKARLARLFPPMLTCTHACVRMRVIKNHAYRNGLKITSPNLANLASGFSSVDARLSPAINLPATLPHVASSQPRCPTSRTSRSTRQWANGCPTTRLPEWHSNVGSPQKTLGTPSPTPQTLGCRNSRASRHSFYVLSECRKGNMISNENKDWETCLQKAITHAISRSKQRQNLADPMHRALTCCITAQVIRCDRSQNRKPRKRRSNSNLFHHWDSALRKS